MVTTTSATKQPPTIKQMATVVEAKLRDIEVAINELLADIHTARDTAAELMRFEAGRLNEIAFVLTRCLCNSDVETAYGLVCGDADGDGLVLGLTA